MRMAETGHSLFGSKSFRYQPKVVEMDGNHSGIWREQLGMKPIENPPVATTSLRVDQWGRRRTSSPPRQNYPPRETSSSRRTSPPHDRDVACGPEALEVHYLEGGVAYHPKATLASVHEPRREQFRTPSSTFISPRRKSPKSSRPPLVMRTPAAVSTRQGKRPGDSNSESSNVLSI